ncbi:putative secreted protein (Por secretion system target) [Mariniflexile fucanivorans]|uniref:Putative secreted protein (Por secretion system target) n=1 Tax=Mariniflexile fucanivorans TaxID=264023 RepID=A0A4R1RJC7_9FLAO|nr:leucine-rich repeat domain-containing protein [Mariniflexile fucanivorans]TCL66251.1 putative secreted protein (Por secretion system target) [Mariniflexile fucanivorans]
MKKKLPQIKLHKNMFSFKSIFFILSLLFASASYSQVDVTVSSLAELKSHLADSNINLTMTPGVYRVTSAVGATTVTYGSNDRKVLFYFEGNNNTFDFTDVTFIVETAVFRAFGNFDVYEFNIVGNNNVLKNLTLVDEGDSVPRDSAINYVIDGKENRLEGFHSTIRGSFPYGYGDAFGKGGGPVIKHYKHSACLVRGRDNQVINSTFIHRSYGHCIFFQAAERPYVDGCYVEGEMRSTDDMLAEAGTGSPADLVNFDTVWGYKLPAGFMMSLGEAGIRAYNGGNTVIDGVAYARETSDPTVKNCTVKYMRTAYGLHQASGTETIENCISIGSESAFDGGIVKNCTADISYGPAFNVSENNLDMEVKIIQTLSTTYNGEGRIASIAGKNSTYKITSDGSIIDPSLKIQIGGGLNSIRHQPGSNLEYQITYTASDNYVSNETSSDLVLEARSSNISGVSCGTIFDDGSNNSVVAVSNCDFSNVGLKVGDTFTTGEISYEVISVNPNEVTVTGSTLVALNIPATAVDPIYSEIYTVTKIRSVAFLNNKIITSLVTPSTLTEIGAPVGNDGTFRGTTNLKSADFSASTSLIALPNVLFRGSAIQSVILPSSLTTYGLNCFRECFSLTSVEVQNSTPVDIGILGNNVFNDVTLSGVTLTVPATTKTAYQSAAVWQNFAPINEASALSTKEIEQELGFSMYPNPVKDELHVSLNKADLNDKAVITLYNLTGQVVKKANFKNSTETVLELSDLSSGLYILRYSDQNKTITKKVIKE